MKIIKFLCIISFLLTSNIGDNAQPVIIILFLYFYQFINDLLHFTATPSIFWEGLIVIPVIGTLSILVFFKQHKNKSLLYLSILALLISLIELTGLIHFPYSAIKLSFTIPFIIFIISALLLIIKYNKKRKS